MKTVPKIVAIGGGEISELETAAIDRRIIELTGKTRPKALFIPTASSDAPGYIDDFEACYGKHFGCQTRTLELTQNPPTFLKVCNALGVSVELETPELVEDSVV